MDPGLLNSDAGPDFLNAKVKIDGVMWAGCVEMHLKSSDWFLHGHDRDVAYENVVLHVCETVDGEVKTLSGRRPPQVVMEIPKAVRESFSQLMEAHATPPCRKIVSSMHELKLHSWLSALQAERLEQKTEALLRRVSQSEGSWEAACFATLARGYGFGVNGEAFEMWAHHIPLTAAAHHRDDLFQVEALFMGQAGLLQPEAIPERYREQALTDDYFIRLRNEYAFLAHKFHLEPMDHGMWKFLRLRPQNFPHIRLSQLANLYHSRRADLSQLVAQESLKDVRRQLTTGVSTYWETHFIFGAESLKSKKTLSESSKRLLIINAIVPLLFAYGRHRGDEKLCFRAFDLLEQLPPEDNVIIRSWAQSGLEAHNAGDSQALVQLQKNYCNKKDCLRCRIGYEYLSSPLKSKNPYNAISLLAEEHPEEL